MILHSLLHMCFESFIRKFTYVGVMGVFCVKIFFNIHEGVLPQLLWHGFFVMYLQQTFV